MSWIYVLLWHHLWAWSQAWKNRHCWYCLDAMPLEKVFSCTVSLLSLIMTVLLKGQLAFRKIISCISDTMFWSLAINESWFFCGSHYPRRTGRKQKDEWSNENWKELILSPRKYRCQQCKWIKASRTPFYAVFRTFCSKMENFAKQTIKNPLRINKTLALMKLKLPYYICKLNKATSYKNS